MTHRREQARVLRSATWLVGLSCVMVLLFPHQVTLTISAATRFSMNWLDTPILWLTSGMLLLCLLLMLGPWGKWRLGRAGEKPEFGILSWLAMLFAAGMGSGLVFWGVAEPLTHYVSPPPVSTDESLRSAMAFATTYFHWGLHAWAIYAMAGLAIAWFSYRHNAAESPSGALQYGLAGLVPAGPLRRLGELADILAMFAVVFGVAAALANGTILLHEGLSRVSGRVLPQVFAYVIILLSMGLVFLASARSGLRRGIRWLSSGNLMLAFLLMGLVLIFASKTAVMEALLQGGWQYLEILPSWSWQLTGSGDDRGWAMGWTVTYLLWWIAWAPFVGVFIARISRGRTIRSFVAGVLLVPVVFSMAWFAVMGGGALAWDAQHQGQLLHLVQTDYTAPLFAWLGGISPQWVQLGQLLIWMACLLLFVFLVTSADSAAFVLGMLSGGGDPNPSRRSTLLWGSLTLMLAAGLLARDSADVNKAVAIAGAIPYAFLLLLQLLALLRSLMAEQFSNNAKNTG